jgi:hypothetical protein
MAKRIDKPGRYNVTIKNPHWVKLEEKDCDKNRMSAILPGVTTVNGEEQYINGELYFTKKIIGSGKNAGKKIADLSKKTLIELGMTEPFNPANIKKELEGVEASFEVALEPDQDGKEHIKVKFINPIGRKELPPEEASAIWANIMGGSSGQVSNTTAAVETENPDDDIPF